MGSKEVSKYTQTPRKVSGCWECVISVDILFALTSNIYGHNIQIAIATKKYTITTGLDLFIMSTAHL